jgi:hypothetical protein
LDTAEAMIDGMSEETIVRFERSRGSLRDRVREHAEYMLLQIPKWAELSRSLRQVWADLGDPDEPLGKLLARIYSRSADRIQKDFDEAVAADDVPPFETRAAALTLMVAADGALIQAVIAPREFETYSCSGAFSKCCAALIPGHESEDP